jgi:ribonuclease HII
MVKGDDRVDAIKAASILAKVHRDRQMVALHDQYPEYGFAQHKGYPTPSHLAALKQFGLLAEHRRSYGPCRNLSGD